MSTEFLVLLQLFPDMIFQQQLFKILIEPSDSFFCFFTMVVILS